MFSNLDIAYLVREISPVIGNRFLKKVQKVSRDAYRLKFGGVGGYKDLIVLPGKIAYITKYKLKTVREDNFVLFLRKHLTNRKLVSVEQHAFDRVMVLSFEEYSLVVELFAKGNMVLLDKQGVIMMPLRSEAWADRTVKRGDRYVFPRAALNPLEADKKQFFSLLGAREDLFHVLLKNYNAAAHHIEEIIFLAGLDKSAPSDRLLGKDRQELFKRFKEFYAIDSSRKQPAVYGGIPCAVALTRSPRGGSFDSFNELVDGLVSPSLALVEKKRVSREERVLEKQLEDWERLAREAELDSLKAEAIYYNYQLLSSVLNEIREGRLKGRPLKELFEGLKESKKIAGYDLRRKSFTLELGKT